MINIVLLCSVLLSIGTVDLHATVQPGAVALTWETAHENMVGWQLYRDATCLETFIPANEPGFGARYAYSDTRVPGQHVYRLIPIRDDGTLGGALSVSVSIPSVMVSYLPVLMRSIVWR